MSDTNKNTSVISQIMTSVSIVSATMTICCLLYGLVILFIAQFTTPNSADGSLVRDEQGEIVGSEIIAQGFIRPEYFWPRPSVVDYNASAAGGSNLSPTNPELRDRAKTLVTRFGASADDPVPADLVAASGSGLDPNITLTAAKYQAGRVASARGLTVDKVTQLLMKYATRPGGGLTPQALVNVLLVNKALDEVGK